MAVYIALAFVSLAMGNQCARCDSFRKIIISNLSGAFSLLVTSLLFFYGFRVARKTLDKTRVSLMKQLLYLGMALIFFFGAGEEISWGQRILGFQTPEALSEVNRQEEFNLHNLSAWEASKILDPDRLFDLFWFLFAVLTPAVALVVPTFKKFAGQIYSNCLLGQ